MKYSALLLLIAVTACSRETGPAQSATTFEVDYEIATWKHNAKGAYSIIFDDFCMDEARGIQNHASPEAEARGLVFGFGVVTSLCNDVEWQRAREMMQAGHEAVNHSHTHRCGVLQEPWCTDVWTDEDVDREIDLSSQLMEEHTGVRPSFFIFPYDLFTLGKLEHLKQVGYTGARAGSKKALTPADFKDPFALNFDVKFPPDGLDSQGFALNDYVDQAITSGQLAFRAFHGVADESWGTLKLDELRDHFDYLQARQETHDLWVATITDIIHYNQARRGCQLVTGEDNSGPWLQLTGEAESCPKDVVLSLMFAEPRELIDANGASVSTVNSTYPLVTGERYYVTSDAGPQ